MEIRKLGTKDAAKREGAASFVAEAEAQSYIPNMQTPLEASVMLALFGLGGGEIILLLALGLILFGARKLPELARGLGEGMNRFWEAVDGTGNDAGRSVGGIYEKRAFQALTPDNKVAELYNPILRRRLKQRKRRRGILRFLSGLWSRVLSRLGWK